MKVPHHDTPLTHFQFRKLFGYPLIPMCSQCGMMGDHRMKGGGFYCQIDYESKPTEPKQQLPVSAKTRGAKSKLR